jgi:hypothetical protein
LFYLLSSKIRYGGTTFKTTLTTLTSIPGRYICWHYIFIHKLQIIAYASGDIISVKLDRKLDEISLVLIVDKGVAFSDTPKNVVASMTIP